MKPTLLVTTLALIGSVAFAADPDPKPPKPVDPTATVSGKATITIDVNGKKETREIDLGNAVPLKFGAGGVTIDTKPAQKLPALQRTWLGVATDEPSEEVRAQLPIPDGIGLVVRSVVPDSPAAKAGLEKNDVLTRLDDQILTNHDQVRKLIGMKKDGDTVHLAYFRKGREAILETKLASHADDGTGSVLNLGKVFGDGVINIDLPGIAEVTNALKPLVLQSYLAFNKDGQLSWSTAAKNQVTPNDQWRLLLDEKGQADVGEATKQLEKSLRDAGVDEQAIKEMKKALADAAAALRKAAVDLGGTKKDLQGELQKAVDEIMRGVEQAWRAEAEAALKANPAPAAPSTPPAQKAP